MQPMGEQKYGNLRLIRGGLSRPLTAREQFERDVRAWAARGKVNGDGKYATRALADIAEDYRWPSRVIARVVIDGLVGGATEAWARELAPIVAKFADAAARECQAARRSSQPDRAA